MGTIKRGIDLCVTFMRRLCRCPFSAALKYHSCSARILLIGNSHSPYKSNYMHTFSLILDKMLLKATHLIWSIPHSINIKIFESHSKRPFPVLTTYTTFDCQRSRCNTSCSPVLYMFIMVYFGRHKFSIFQLVVAL